MQRSDYTFEQLLKEQEPDKDEQLSLVSDTPSDEGIFLKNTSHITGGCRKMADSLFNEIYNPDVLSCLANLSNDEVFTPPEVANAMLDMLPQELFSNPDTTFLDPSCKSGVFYVKLQKGLSADLKCKFPTCRNA